MKRDTKKCTFLHFFKNVWCIIGVDIEEETSGNFVEKKGVCEGDPVSEAIFRSIFSEIFLEIFVNFFLKKLGKNW